MSHGVQLSGNEMLNRKVLSYEQVFDVVKTVLARALWTTAYIILVSWCSVSVNVNLYYTKDPSPKEPPKVSVDRVT